MKDLKIKISWRELFFPVLKDLKNINSETDITTVSFNNWNLANDKDDFKIIFEQIEENRASEETKHNYFKMLQSIDDLIKPDNKAIYTHISRIKSAFYKQMTLLCQNDLNKFVERQFYVYEYENSILEYVAGFSINNNEIKHLFSHKLKYYE